ncbi:NHLP bacteriocin system secretion protein [Zobellia sp. B3R18]|uniref:NHLP bacteriocin system secretion protein n=1 Tax=Zobellia sp. B3R18 TaxID=2841568 RepID=UPI001C067183|nr:NHLP bacteriocin system secretion protein [Zobellia sp. B3R18]MBU2974983.1 NHLP bacteriocin system secretion protein [Zobellia sp. B3R18]
MPPTFFRKAALEKLSTPEKLDQMIKVTGPRAWIALSTITVFLATGIIWSFWGNVKTKLNVTGVLLGGEIHEIVSTSQGQLINLKVKIGDQIKDGEIIAAVEQPELEQQIAEAVALLSEREMELEQLKSFGLQDTRLQGEFIFQQRSSILQQIGTQEKTVGFLNRQLDTERELQKKGLITSSQVINTEQQVQGAYDQIESLRAQLAQTSTQRSTLDFDSDQRITLAEQRIAQAQRNLEQLQTRHEIQSNIRSSYSGEVVEVLTDAGVIVGQGTPLFKIKNFDEVASSLRGVLFIPSQDGKKIEVGMEALVAPSTVQPQDYGFMKGKVTYVSDFPITQQGMMTSVKNDQLVQGLLGMGAPFEVHVEFEKDPDSYSGFKWTSANGPKVMINEGTSCLGKVTVKSEPPATIVVPAIKKFFDLY